MQVPRFVFTIPSMGSLDIASPTMSLCIAGLLCAMSDHAATYWKDVTHNHNTCINVHRDYFILYGYIKNEYMLISNAKIKWTL